MSVGSAIKVSTSSKTDAITAVRVSPANEHVPWHGGHVFMRDTGRRGATFRRDEFGCRSTELALGVVTTSPHHMRAVVTTGHGGYERLEFRFDIPVPEPGPRDVLVQVGAAALTATDIITRVGWYSQGDSDTAWTTGSCVCHRERTST